MLLFFHEMTRNINRILQVAFFQHFKAYLRILTESHFSYCVSYLTFSPILTCETLCMDHSQDQSGKTLTAPKVETEACLCTTYIGQILLLSIAQIYQFGYQLDAKWLLIHNAQRKKSDIQFIDTQNELLQLQLQNLFILGVYNKNISTSAILTEI